MLDIDFYSDFLRLRGKTYDYRITFKQIQKLFCLPKPDDIHNQIIVCFLLLSLHRITMGLTTSLGQH